MASSKVYLITFTECYKMDIYIIIYSVIICSSQIKGNNLKNNICQTDLLLYDKKVTKLEKYGGDDILIEYGNYSPDIDEKEKIM